MYVVHAKCVWPGTDVHGQGPSFSPCASINSHAPTCLYKAHTRLAPKTTPVHAELWYLHSPRVLESFGQLGSTHQISLDPTQALCNTFFPLASTPAARVLLRRPSWAQLLLQLVLSTVTVRQVSPCQHGLFCEALSIGRPLS